MELRGQVRSQMEFGNEGTADFYRESFWRPPVRCANPDNELSGHRKGTVARARDGYRRQGMLFEDRWLPLRRHLEGTSAARDSGGYQLRYDGCLGSLL